MGIKNSSSIFFIKSIFGIFKLQFCYVWISLKIKEDLMKLDMLRSLNENFILHIHIMIHVFYLY